MTKRRLLKGGFLPWDNIPKIRCKEMFEAFENDETQGMDPVRILNDKSYPMLMYQRYAFFSGNGEKKAYERKSFREGVKRMATQYLAKKEERKFEGKYIYLYLSCIYTIIFQC